EITAPETVVTDAGRRVVYVPDEGFAGTEAFQFNVSDGALDSLPAVLTLTLLPDAGGRSQWVAGRDFAAIERPNDEDDTSNPNALVPEWSYACRDSINSRSFTPHPPPNHADSASHADLDGYGVPGTDSWLLVHTGDAPI